VEITKEFPYFSWGFALLAKIYNEREDFRTETLMHQAALRVSDREWLYNYIHGTLENLAIELVDTATTEPNYDELIESPAAQSAFISPVETTAIDTTNVVKNNPIEIAVIDAVDTMNVEIQKPDDVEVITESTSLKVPSDEDQEEVIDASEFSQNTILEIKTPNPPNESANSDESKSTPTLEELKSAFLKSKPVESEETTFVHLNEYDSEDNEVAHIDNFEESFSESKSISSTDSAIVTESENSFFQPVIEPSDLSDTIRDIDYIPNTFEPEITSPETKKTKGYYNIEDYYSLPPEAYNQYQFKAVSKENEPKTTQQKNSTNDFYSWLNSDIPQNAPAIKPIERREDLLDKFLKNKPLPTRQKQDFYSPEKAGKRSDTLSNQIVTETLANIYYKQGNFSKAIEAYQQLQLKFPEKMSYFANLIEKIKKERIS
jgi:tetratricopeptide (TPR) repeat protein